MSGELTWFCPQCGMRIIAYSNEGLYTRRNLHENVHRLDSLMTNPVILRFTRDDLYYMKKWRLSPDTDTRTQLELDQRYKPKTI